MVNPWKTFLAGCTDPAGGSASDVEGILDLLAELEVGCVLFRRALSNRLGLTETEHLVIDVLVRHGGLAGSQLSGVTGLTSAAVTQLADRLQGEGYLLREPDPLDGRRRRLVATDKAVEHIRSTLDDLQIRDPRRVNAELIDGLSDSDLDAVTVFLSRAADRAFRQARSLRSGRREPSRWRSRGPTSRPAPPRSAPA